MRPRFQSQAPGPPAPDPGRGPAPPAAAPPRGSASRRSHRRRGPAPAERPGTTIVARTGGPRTAPPEAGTAFPPSRRARPTFHSTFKRASGRWLGHAFSHAAATSTWPGLRRPIRSAGPRGLMANFSFRASPGGGCPTSRSRTSVSPISTPRASTCWCPSTPAGSRTRTTPRRWSGTSTKSRSYPGGNGSPAGTETQTAGEWLLEDAPRAS